MNQQSTQRTAPMPSNKKTALRPIAVLLLLALLLVAWQSTTARADGRGYTRADAEMLAQTVWGEARGCDATQQAAVVWCILNRVDNDRFPNTIREVVTQPWQFSGYSGANPVDAGLLALVYDVLARWNIELECVGGVGRVLPREYLYFSGDGVTNRFRTAYSGGTVWNWSLPSPYENADGDVEMAQSKRGATVIVPKSPENQTF